MDELVLVKGKQGKPLPTKGNFMQLFIPDTV